MNVQRDPDAILAAWLEEGPTRLPEQTRRTIAVTTRTTEQKRRPAWAPWRTPSMPNLARVAVAAIALIIAIGGAVYLIGPGQGVGGAPPTVPTAWTFYTSNRFGYTIVYPTGWIATPATADWPAIDFPDKFGQEHDVFFATATSPRLFVSSVPLVTGKTAADWLTAMDAFNAGHACQLSSPHSITVDGLGARQQDGVCMGSDHLIEVAMADNSRFYQINLFGQSGPFTDTDRATFDRVLASFRVGPAAAPSPTRTVPTAWTTYTSSRFAFSMDYPTGWFVTPATGDWPAVGFPFKFGQELDVFFDAKALDTRVFVSSVPLKAGKSVADWLTELDTFNGQDQCQLSAPRTITIDGVAARQKDGVCMGDSSINEVVMSDGKRFYQINLFGGPFTDTDRATFDRFLASFRFGA